MTKDDVGYEYTLRPILLVVPRGAPDAAFEARKRDADALRARFADCADGIPFARALKEVAVRDQIMKFSADLPPALRDILDKTDVGHLTPPEQTAEGIQMFALCCKKETKTDTPGQKEVRDEMSQQKFGAQAKRYLAEIAALGDDRIQIDDRCAASERIPPDHAVKQCRATFGIDPRRARRHRSRSRAFRLASARRAWHSRHFISSAIRIFSPAAPRGSASTFRSPP